MSTLATKTDSFAILTDDEDDETSSILSSENELFTRQKPAKTVTFGKDDRTTLLSMSAAAAPTRDVSLNNGNNNSSSRRSANKLPEMELLSPIMQTATSGHYTAPNGGANAASVGEGISVSGASTFALTPTIVCVLLLLAAAFPVHFPAVLLPQIRPDDVPMRSTLICAIVGAACASMFADLASVCLSYSGKRGGSGTGIVRRSLFVACSTVLLFSLVRCLLPTVVPAAVLGVAGFLAGFGLTTARLTIAQSWRCRDGDWATAALDGRATGEFVKRKGWSNDATYFHCGLVTLAFVGAPFISAAIQLVLLGPTRSSSTSASSTTLVANTMSNVTPSQSSEGPYLVNTSDFSLTNTTQASTPVSPQTGDDYDGGRHVALALFVCLMLCSFGAFLLTLCSVENDRLTSFGPGDDDRPNVSRLALSSLKAFTRRHVALLAPFAVFIGAQQFFAYFTFLHAFTPLNSRDLTPVLGGLCMAVLALLLSAPIGYLARYTGRVKLLVPVFAVVTSLLLVILLLESALLRTDAAYYIIGSLWSICDCIMNILFAAMVCSLPVTSGSDHTSILCPVGALSMCSCLGQLVVFVTTSCSVPPSAIAAVLFVLLVASVVGYLGTEISLRLAERDALAAGGGRQGQGGRYVSIADAGVPTWLPRVDPVEQPRQETVKPLFTHDKQQLLADEDELGLSE